MSVILETTLGDITVDLFTEERRRSCLNFLKLCKIKYYNYCLFFSVQRNFIAQTGDPSGSGKGGESIFMKAYGEQAKYFDMELKPKIKHTRRGMISFVNNGNNMHGSQFVITLCDNLDYLDGKHTVFGEVAEGFSVLDKINESICDKENRPYQDIRINHTIVLDDPFDDLVGVDIPDRSPQPTREQLESGRIGADEEIDENKGKTLKEIEDAIEEKDLKIGTQILETVGDIKDASLNPPENVLFICKLNMVTTAEDLEIIFSRFGPVLSCEIIRDHKSGDSLCYGFIEFEKIADCEKAYFKMDNVLIDDRRIHVNFCQSIAKHKWSKSGLRSKYSFAEKETHQGNVPIQERAKKVALKSRPHRDEYQMVFNDTNHAEDTDEDRKSKDKKEKKKQRKMNRRNEESDEDETSRKKERKREADASRKQYSRSHAVYSSKRDEQYSMEKGHRQHKRYKSDEKKKSYSTESSSEETERGFEKSKRSKKEQRGTHASRVARSSNERKQNSIKEKRSRNINTSSCEESCDEERTYRKNSKHKKKRKS